MSFHCSYARSRARVAACVSLLLASALGSVAATAATTCTVTNCSALLSSVTESTGSFQGYDVTVNSLKLYTATGTYVELMPGPTSIDLTQLVDLEPEINMGLIPAGDYVVAKMIIDYSKAKITAANSAGKTVTLKPVTPAGAALSGTETATVELESGVHFVVSPTSPTQYSIGFNLTTANSVNFTNSTVKVSPTILADVIPAGGTHVQVAGGFKSVDLAGHTFVLSVPATKTVAAHTVTLSIGPTTQVQFDGNTYSGTAGVDSLSVLRAGTAISAAGVQLKGATLVDASSVVVQ